MKYETEDRVVFKGTVSPEMRVDALIPTDDPKQTMLRLSWPSKCGGRQIEEVAHPAQVVLVEPLMQFLRMGTQVDSVRDAICVKFGAMASDILDALPPNAERTEALRRLIDAKAAAIRALEFQS